MRVMFLTSLLACASPAATVDDGNTSMDSTAQPVSVLSVQPTLAYVAPTRTVIISGEGFTAEMRVKFADAWSPAVEFRDAFTLAAKTPEDMPEGKVAITVIGPTKKAALPDAFEFIKMRREVPLADFEGASFAGVTTPPQIPDAPLPSPVLVDTTNLNDTTRNSATDPVSSLQPAQRPGVSSQALRLLGNLIPVSAAENETIGGWDFLLGGSETSFYDLSNYVGLRFYAREATASPKLTVRFGDVNTTAVGMVCTSACFGDYRFEVPLSDEWRAYQVDFEGIDEVGRFDFARYPYGEPKKQFAVRQVRHVAFLVPNLQGSRPIDFWLDDVRLLRADLIDNCEDNDDLSEANPTSGDTTGGSWFRFASTGSTESNNAAFRPTTTTRPFVMAGAPFAWGSPGQGALNSSYYARFVAKVAGSGGGVGLALRSPDEQGTPQALDASGYEGISFWAKTATATPQILRVSIASRTTDAAGGLCSACDDHFNTNIVLSNSWKRFELPFASLTQSHTGDATRFDSRGIYRILFTAAAGVVDFSVDELRFVLPEAQQ